MEKKIGEKFEFRGVMLEVVESEPGDCKDCYGLGNGCLSLPDCLSTLREDEKSVQFVHTIENFNNYGGISSITAGKDYFQPNKPAQTFFDAYTDLIAQADRVAKLEQTPEQQSVSNATVDWLIAMRNRLSGLDVTTRVEDYGEYSGHDAPTMVSEE